MSSIKNIISKYGLYASKYSYNKSARILTIDDKKVVIKKRKELKTELFNYLDSRDFKYALKPTNLTEEEEQFEIYPFIEDKVLLKEEKAVDLMYVLSLLHNKTSFYKEVVLDDIKAIYEGITSRIEYLYYYYRDLQDTIENKVYMAPDEYLLMRNVSLIYMALNYSKETLDVWYEETKKIKTIRYVLLHNKIDTSHFLDADEGYLISWDNYSKGLPIYDFLNFFKEEYHDLDMISLFNIYKHKYPFTKLENLLFYTLISLPEKVELTINDYNKYTDVYNLVLYLNKSRDFILKQDESYQKADKQKQTQ